ncbi:F-box/LRR-repeat protein fbxl-1-like isoform X2 [Nasonia vitripennis]|nr:F-box/LRR-repeat protein fbxl-1-like isoform X2 [Nasonia vitripennis]XP_031787349.1 F-box/LRR-repeat protein fbxl-1-like isoform X2 [Nasonia vitripennis]XP_031787350.1 F-box/LRR-repeat protein fbxl-1-like isoform X2 [Nasonia vitripennis]
MEACFGYLNCDCLMHIFSFLPIRDRVNVELVCKQWYSAGRELWKSFKQLDVCRSKWQFKNLKKFKRVEMTMFKTVLERCGRYLTEIDFTHLSTIDEEIYFEYTIDDDKMHEDDDKSFEGIMALASNCTNIEKLSLSSTVVNCNDQHLLDIFKTNKKIRFLNLIGYGIHGTCFNGLSAHVIETLLMQYCCVQSKRLCKLLERCVNLNILSLNCTRSFNTKNFGDILRCVSLVNIKSLKEFRFVSYYDNNRETHLYTSFHVNTNFKNLIAIQIMEAMEDSMNDLLIALGKHCTNLRRANFSDCVGVTDDILINITTLPKLEVLCIDRMEHVTDRSLICLSEHLKILKCSDSQISDTGVITLLNKSQNIEILNLSMCKNISKRSVDYAICVTKHRTNNIILNFCVDHYYGEKCNVKDKSPLFRLHYELTAKEEQLHTGRGCSYIYPFFKCEKNLLQKSCTFNIDSNTEKTFGSYAYYHFFMCFCQRIPNDENN